MTQYNRCRITKYPTMWPGPLLDAVGPDLANNCTSAHPCFALYEELILADQALDVPQYTCGTNGLLKQWKDQPSFADAAWTKQQNCIWKFI